MEKVNNSVRLGSVDALRGFALLAIVLLHNLEHYNIFGAPAAESSFMRWLDSAAYDSIFFMLAGKAYATFSLLFGFSFFIQLRNARRRGCDFRARFAWRMLLLVCFSQFHALFYNGDILLLYAFCGLILIPASGWKDKTVLIVASVLMLQPYAWAMVFYGLANPDYVNANNSFMQFAASAEEVGRTGNIWQMLANNIWNGQLYSNFWQVEAGRLFQTPALFLFGMWLGRKSLFVKSASAISFWKKVLVVALIAAVPLYFLCRLVPGHIETVTVLAYYCIAVPMVYNFAFMCVLVAAFMLVWFHAGDGRRWQRFIIPYGRMSLTNYIFQSIMGVFVYYHFGFGMYDMIGAFGAVRVGLGIFAVQWVFST
ncbi:MAG: DUF418 domain-containing protein, partial [Paramuribaculum sp.]|nr:DUF418 domain-containing protein [Paramuribaculum sp.]